MHTARRATRALSAVLYEVMHDEDYLIDHYTYNTTDSPLVAPFVMYTGGRE
jgi:hypothetical protein